MIHQGDKLKEIVRESGLTDTMLAEKLGMSRGGVQNMYLRPKIKAQQIREVSVVLNISFEMLDEKLNNEKENKSDDKSMIDIFSEMKTLYEHRIKDKEDIIKLLQEKIEWLEKKR